MARKTRRKPVPRLSGAQLHRPEVATVEGDAAARVTFARALPSEAQLADEYRYVLDDLKKIGLIALGMLAFLLILAFVLV